MGYTYLSSAGDKAHATQAVNVLGQVQIALTTITSKLRHTSPKPATFTAAHLP